MGGETTATPCHRCRQLEARQRARESGERPPRRISAQDKAPQGCRVFIGQQQLRSVLYADEAAGVAVTFNWDGAVPGPMTRRVVHLGPVRILFKGESDATS